MIDSRDRIRIRIKKGIYLSVAEHIALEPILLARMQRLILHIIKDGKALASQRYIRIKAVRGHKAYADRIPGLSAPRDNNISTHRLILRTEHTRMCNIIGAGPVRIIMQLTAVRLLEAIFERNRANRPICVRVYYRYIQLSVTAQ